MKSFKRKWLEVFCIFVVVLFGINLHREGSDPIKEVHEAIISNVRVDRKTPLKSSSMPNQVLPADNKVLITDPIIKLEVRRTISKRDGELTEADLEKVVWLSLSDPQINDQSLKQVVKLKQLKELWLSGTQITDVGIKEVIKLQKLEMLRVRGTKVTEFGVAELKKALPNCQIDGP